MFPKPNVPSEPVLLVVNESVQLCVSCEPTSNDFGNDPQTKSDEHDETLILWELAGTLAFVIMQTSMSETACLFPLSVVCFPKGLESVKQNFLPFAENDSSTLKPVSFRI